MTAKDNPPAEQPQQPEANESTKLIEKKSKWSVLNIAKNYKNSKRVMKYAGGAAVVGVGVAVVVPFLGVAMLFGLALGGIAFMATVLLAINKIRSFSGTKDIVDMASKAAASQVAGATAKAASQSTVDVKVESEAPKQYTLWDMKGTVCVFGVEPTIQEIIKVNNTTDATAPGLERIANGTAAVILLDEGRDAVKIKVCDGEHTNHVGWVARTSLMGLEKKAV